MENEHITLVNFDTISEGVEFMININTPFAFMVDNQTFKYVGGDSLIEVVDTPEEFDLYNFGEIYLDIHEVPSPGVLYIDNGFLKYYKEI
jgi:protein associated with RNAse G/E